jgi:hypothetical protein
MDYLMICLARRKVGAYLILVAVTGCGRTGDHLTAPVSGTVTLDGKSLTGGTITFFPEQGKMASGRIQPDGTFTLTTYQSGDGAITGKCRAAIAVLVGGGEENEDKPVERSALPRKYSSPETSGLEYEVTANGPNNFQLELKSG